MLFVYLIIFWGRWFVYCYVDVSSGLYAVGRVVEFLREF